MNTPKLPTFRKSEIVIQQSQNELLIYDLKTNRAFSLNETSALIYQLCDGTKSVAEISQLVSDKLKTPVVEEFVWLALDHLNKNNLLENGGDLRPDFGGLSRRQVIKKIGLTTAIALPVVASLIAPSAAGASSMPTNTGCNSDSSCGALAIVGSPCTCSSISCNPPYTLNLGISIGACVTASAAANAGVNLSANVNGFVCLYTAVCIAL